MTAANTFHLFNSGRLAVGLSIEMDAPTGAALNMPLQLPDILVNPSATPYSPFSLTLTPHTGVINNPVQILAAPPQIAGKNTWSEKSFVPIGFLPSLPVGPSDITHLFVAKYGVPSARAEVCLRLVATSQAGLRRGSLLVIGFCTGVSVAQTGTDDSEAKALLQAA